MPLSRYDTDTTIPGVRPNILDAVIEDVSPAVVSNVKPDYDPNLDPAINPLLRAPEHLPNCPDGRYRPNTT